MKNFSNDINSVIDGKNLQYMNMKPGGESTMLTPTLQVFFTLRASFITLPYTLHLCFFYFTTFSTFVFLLLPLVFFAPQFFATVSNSSCLSHFALFLTLRPWLSLSVPVSANVGLTLRNRLKCQVRQMHENGKDEVLSEYLVCGLCEHLLLSNEDSVFS